MTKGMILGDMTSTGSDNLQTTQVHYSFLINSVLGIVVEVFASNIIMTQENNAESNSLYEQADSLELPKFYRMIVKY